MFDKSDLFVIAWWVADRAIKVIIDEDDNRRCPPHDTTFVRKVMLEHFKIKDKYVSLFLGSILTLDWLWCYSSYEGISNIFVHEFKSLVYIYHMEILHA